MIGLYVHFPFCEKKCDYCDFYSLKYDSITAENYVKELCTRLKDNKTVFDTVYFGGGTPSLLKSSQIQRILHCCKLSENCEITLEANPNSAFKNWEFNPKINRISMGLQSANFNELKSLGRIHNTQDVITAVKKAREFGIENISLDLMLGIPYMTKESLLNSIEFCEKLNIQHISCYMLKIEEGTPFFENYDKLNLPDEDETCDLYLYMIEELEKRGFYQYEISNFAKPGFESKHNLKYWNSEEYLGLGPAAHSYINGKRMCFPRDLKGFLNGNAEIFQSFGGDFEEFAMLKLRLSKGLYKSDCEKFGFENFEKVLEIAKTIPQNLITINKENIRLTSEGFLLSNTILSKLL